MHIIKRDIYLNKLIARKDNSAIKIITGIRRSGKSFLLFNLFYNYLLKQNVPNDHIIKISLDDDKYESLKDKKELRTYVEKKIIDSKTYYLFIDEVQMCDGFEAVLNGLNKIENLDIYVTGSNSKFLSSDIVTEFRGRGDEVRVYPLSFKEYYSDGDLNFNDAWKNFLTYGGLPFIITKKTHEEKTAYLKTLFEYTYIKDILERNNLKDEKVLDTLINVLASSIGSFSSAKKISDTFKSKGYKTTDLTISDYIKYLLDAFVILKAQKFDIKGRKYISSPAKYYFTDIGLRNAKLDFRQQEENHIMENIIYNELLIRGYSVDVGMVIERQKENDKLNYKQLEIDFVCNDGTQKYYIQSVYSIPNSKKMNQETRPLLKINDSFKKIIIVKDDINTWVTDDGIIIMGLKQFLLSDRF